MMQALLSDIGLGVITSKFNIGNNAIRIRYKTGAVTNNYEHIWLSDIVLANNLKISGTVAVFEYGVGYTSIVMCKNGINLSSRCNSADFKYNCDINNIEISDVDGQYDNIIFMDISEVNLDRLNYWNRNGRIIIVINDKVDAGLLKLLRDNKIHYNIYNMASNVIAASDGSKTNYTISVIDAISIDYNCIYRSDMPIRNEQCPSCNNKLVNIDIYSCKIHNECVISGVKYKACMSCVDRVKP